MSEAVKYIEIIDMFAKEIKKHHMKSIKKVEREVNWTINIYLEACYSGSALNSGRKWASI